MESLQGLFGLMGSRVVSVPDSGIVVVVAGDDDCTHDGGDVEGGPLGNELVQHHLLSQSLIASPLLQLVLDGDTTRIVDGLGHISVVVGLDQEPGGISEGICSMGLVGIPLEDSALIA